MAPRSTISATTRTNRRCRAASILIPVYCFRRRSVPDRACRSRRGVLFSGRPLVAKGDTPMAKADPETSALKEQLADALSQMDSLQAAAADAEARAETGRERLTALQGELATARG